MAKREILALLFRERLKIVIAFLVPVIAAVGLYAVAPRTYQAEAKVLIRIGRDATSGELGQSPMAIAQATVQEVLNSEIAILSSRDIAVATLKEFGPRTLFPRLEAQPAPDLSPSDDAVRDFEEALNVAPGMNSTIITVSYEAPTPVLATRVLSRVLGLYRQRHSEAYARPNSNFLKLGARGPDEFIDHVDVVPQTIEDPAAVTSDRPAHPKRLTYAAVGLAGGIILAAFVVVFMFTVHNTYLTPEAIEASVDIPVLASLSVDRARAGGKRLIRELPGNAPQPATGPASPSRRRSLT